MRVICVLAGDEFGKKQERWFDREDSLFSLAAGRVPAGQGGSQSDRRLC